MVSQTGKYFEDKIRRWHNGIRCVTFKFPDFKATGSHQLAWCDRVTVTPTGTFWFECKHTNSKISFRYDAIKEHQWHYMIQLDRLQGNAYFLLEDGNHQVYMIVAEELFKLFDGKKSIKFATIADAIINKTEFQRFIGK